MIGNPPYIKEYVCKAAFDGFREVSPYYMGKMDLWYGFACHGIDMLAPHGQLCFIAQNNWTTSAGAKKMRKKVIADTRIVQMIDFNDYMVFSEDNPGGPQIQTMIMQFEKSNEEDNYVFCYRTLAAGSTREQMRDIIGECVSSAITCVQPVVSRMANVESSISLVAESPILRKLEKKMNFKFEDDEVVQGIIGNPDEAFKIEDAELNGLSKSEKAFVHKFYTHTDRYVTHPSSTNVIYLSAKSSPGFKLGDYPGIKARIEPYAEKLKDRREVLNGRLKWYYMHWPRSKATFDACPKIVWAARTEGRNFMYTENEFYGSRNLFYLETNRINLKYLLGVLNSSLYKYYMDQKLKHLGALLQLDKGQIVKVPIFNPEGQCQKPIIALVDKILAAKAKDAQADTSELESQIDTLVYDLYGLTEEEIAVVEGRLKLG